MQILTFRLRDEYVHTGDVAHLIAVALKHGYIISPNDAIHVWREHSDTMCAGWLMMEFYTDDALMDVLLSYTDARKIDYE